MNTLKRFAVYQKERFPLVMYVPLVAVFSFSAISYSALIRGGAVSLHGYLVSFINTLSFFMLLRISDEYKDKEDDAKYRPYRPVPRGLVKLTELRNIGVVLVVLQLVMCLTYHPKLIGLLIPIWLYFFCMHHEFFCKRFLTKHMALYMISHMFIMPLLDLYAAGCDFVPVRGFGGIPAVLWFISSSFFDGIVIEVGRKLRAPEDEETGVDTYSKMWGRKISAAVFIGCMAVSFCSTLVATSLIGGMLPALIIIPVVLAVCAVCTIRYCMRPTHKNSRLMETLSGVWTFADYFCLGIIPWILSLI